MSHQPKSFNNISTKTQKTSSNSNTNQNLENKQYYPKKSSSDLLETVTYFEKKFQEGTYSGGVNYVETFGSNEMGQLGKEVEVNSPFSYNPVLINSLTNNKIISISAGDGHTVCVSKEGVVYAWGASACGQLGLDDNDSMPRDSEGYPFQPTPIPIRLMSGVKIKEVACGDAHTLAMTTEGKVFSWGGAGCGQLGHPNINEMPKDADNCPYQPYPRIIETLKALNMVHIACGKAHSLSIDSNGCLFTWGAGACGQLGVEEIQTLPVDDDGYPYQPVPKYLKSLKDQNIIHGVCGDVHTLVLNDKGEVFSFGGGSFGQLGLGAISKMPLDSDRYPFMPIPTKIDLLNDIQIVSIACGDSHSMAIDCDGRLYAWGAAACGQLGLGSLYHLPKDGEGNPYQPEPKLVTFFENFKVFSISCGEAHTLVLCEGGILYSFGGSSCGQLGYPEIKDSKVLAKSIFKSLQTRVNEVPSLKYEKPKLVTSLLGKHVFKTACGGVHNIILINSFPSLNNNLYMMMKNELSTDIQIFLEYNSITRMNIKCHKYVLISKSNFFFKRLITNQEEVLDKNEDDNEILCTNVKCVDSSPNKIIINGNYNMMCLKTIIEYLYLDDISFLNNIEFNKNTTYLDQLTDYLKISALLELKLLQNEIENKIRISLVKHSEALKSVNMPINTLYNNPNNNYIDTENLNEEFTIDENNINNSCRNETNYKGLFFLPNGNALLLINEEIIESVVKNSMLINFNNNGNANVNSNKNSGKKMIQSESYKIIDRNNKLITTTFLANKPKEFILNNQSNLSYTEDNFINISSANISSLNKTISFFEVNKHLFETLMSTEEFDLFEVLMKFNLIDSETNLNSNNLSFLKNFNKQATSDIVIKIENKVFYGHKVILISSSKYFELMLSENLKENTKGEILITEYSAEEFFFLMLFLYCDCLILDLERSLELLKGADMFAVDCLKFKLENLLSSKLDIENAAKIFKYASFYNFDILKKVCLAFINDNYKQVIETQEFEDLHRESMLEIIRFCKSR